MGRPTGGEQAATGHRAAACSNRGESSRRDYDTGLDPERRRRTVVAACGRVDHRGCDQGGTGPEDGATVAEAPYGSCAQVPERSAAGKRRKGVSTHLQQPG